MSTILVSSDKKHYVLSLSLEEAQLLGTFHHKHVSGMCPLNRILRGLPVLTHAEFNTETAFGWKPVFHDIVLQADATSTHKVIDCSRGVERHLDYVVEQNIEALEARVLSLIEQGRFSSPLLRPNRPAAVRYVPPQAQPLPRPRWRVECNFALSNQPERWGPSMNQHVAGVTFATKREAEEAFRKAPWFNSRLHGMRYRAAPVDAEQCTEVLELKPGWIVQFQHPGEWRRLRTRGLPPGVTYPAERVYLSRNEAYRQLRLRAERFGKPEGRYRVVPEGTPDGPEKDRGYYVVEFWSKHYRDWRVTLNGPGIKNNSDGGQYKTAAAAAEDIKKFGYGGQTYRVKWRSSKA